MSTSRISIAVHQLTRLFLNAPDLRLSASEVAAFMELEPDEADIVISTLKDAGFLVEHNDGTLAARSVPAV